MLRGSPAEPSCSTDQPAQLRARLEQGRLIELHAMRRPAEDLALYRAEMAEWPGPEPLRPRQIRTRDRVRANDACRRDILGRLTSAGPLTPRELPDACAVPWASTGGPISAASNGSASLRVAPGGAPKAGPRSRRGDLGPRPASRRRRSLDMEAA